MAHNNPIDPTNADVLDALNELEIKDEILIKEETLDFEVGENIWSTNVLEEVYRLSINCNDINISNSMATLEAAAAAIVQNNGTNRKDAEKMIRASKAILKSMREILKDVQALEAGMQIVPDYDLSDETKILSLGWYNRMVRQNLDKQKLIGNAIARYPNMHIVPGLTKHLNASARLFSTFQAHAVARYPNYQTQNVQ